MPTHKPATQAALHLVFFILLLDVIGISLLYPVAPYLVRRYSNSALMLTVLTAAYAAAQFFAAPFLGKLGDRYGRRPVLLLCLLGSALGYVLFGIGGALWLLITARIIDGITGGNQSVASAYIADVSQPEERAKNFTLIGSAWGIGLIFGPALGALLGQINLAAPAFIAAALSLAGLLCGVFLLPESLPRDQRATMPLRVQDLNPFPSIHTMAQKPRLGVLLAALCLFNFAFNGINSTETLFLIEKFAARPWQVGALLVLAGVTITLVQRLVPRLVSRYGEQSIAVVCLIGYGIGALATFFAPFLWLIYPISGIRTMTSGFIFPTLGALMANRVSSHEQGILMGVTTALTSSMTILGPLWAGAIYDWSVGAPYWMGAGVLMLAAFMLVQPQRVDQAVNKE